MPAVPLTTAFGISEPSSGSATVTSGFTRSSVKVTGGVLVPTWPASSDCVTTAVYGPSTSSAWPGGRAWLLKALPFSVASKLWASEPVGPKMSILTNSLSCWWVPPVPENTGVESLVWPSLSCCTTSVGAGVAVSTVNVCCGGDGSELLAWSVCDPVMDHKPSASGVAAGTLAVYWPPERWPTIVMGAHAAALTRQSFRIGSLSPVASPALPVNVGVLVVTKPLLPTSSIVTFGAAKSTTKLIAGDWPTLPAASVCSATAL